MPRGHGTLTRQSTQSALSSDNYRIQQGAPAAHSHQKTAALRLISFCLCFFWLIEPFGVCVLIFHEVLIVVYEHKTTAFKAWQC